MKVNEILLFGVLCWHEKCTYQYTSTYSSDKDTLYANSSEFLGWVPVLRNVTPAPPLTASLDDGEKALIASHNLP